METSSRGGQAITMRCVLALAVLQLAISGTTAPVPSLGDALDLLDSGQGRVRSFAATFHQTRHSPLLAQPSRIDLVMEIMDTPLPERKEA